MTQNSIKFSSIFFLTLCLSFATFGKGKAYYLVPSAHVDEMIDRDKVLLDSAMNVYHSSAEDTVRLSALVALATSLQHYSWKDYTVFFLEECRDFIGKFDITKQEKDKASKLLSIGVNNLAFLELSNGEFDKAQKHFKESIIVSKSIGDLKTVANSLIKLAHVYREVGKPESSKIELEHALAISKQINDVNLEVECYGGLAYYHLMFEDLKYAKSYAERGLSLIVKSQNPEKEAHMYFLLGQYYTLTKEYKNAQANLTTSIGLLEKIEATPQLASVYTSLGNIHRVLSSNQKAIDCFNEVLGILKKYPNPSVNHHTTLNLAKMYYETGDYSLASKYANEAIKVAKGINSSKRMTSAYFIAHQTAVKLKKWKAAYGYYQEYAYNKALFQDNNLRMRVLSRLSEMKIEVNESKTYYASLFNDTQMIKRPVLLESIKRTSITSFYAQKILLLFFSLFLLYTIVTFSLKAIKR